MPYISLIDDFSARKYQESIFANSMNKNSLVVLPTGLGKTIIALMLAVYYYNNSEGKKILVMAPTKPLAEQQMEAFKSMIKNEKEFSFSLLTGKISPSNREECYKSSDFIFATPQIIENDLINSIVNPADFSFLVFDEAHRATGNYSYTFIAEQFTSESSAKFLALTASPGSDKGTIEEVLENLNIEHLEVKDYEDEDVKPYVHETEIEKYHVEFPKEYQEPLKKFNKVYNEKVEELREQVQVKKKTLSKKELLDMQKELRTMISKGENSSSMWRAVSISAALIKLHYAIELLESQDIRAVYNYVNSFFKESNRSKAIDDLIGNIDFREAFEYIISLNEKGSLHPKIKKVEEIVDKEREDSQDIKFIVFAQYRETASRIVEELSKREGLKPVLFVGQAKKGGEGLSQKEQNKVLQQFRDGEYNVLVSTSVGEEGLDIPKVDMVIFYEPLPSAIRTIQRVGRTGRFRKGKAAVLITKDTKDVAFNFVASAKERKMYKVLNDLKKKFENKDSQNNEKKNEKTLDQFMKKQSSSQENNQQQDNNDEKLSVYIDTRENYEFVKELYRSGELNVVSKQLDVADIVISENIAAERKTKQDFVDSIVDKRLFKQLMSLAKNYRRPFLILEGEENLFSLRNIHPNVIRSALSSIAIDMRIPIMYTQDVEETARMVNTIGKRTIRAKKDVSLPSEKSSTEQEEMEKFVGSIPKVNIVTARSILEYFGSIERVVNADEKDLSDVKGVGKVRARHLKEFFEKEYKSEE